MKEDGFHDHAQHIGLDLKKHCIETEIKHRYNRVLSELLKARPGRPETADLERRLQMLKNALERFDFQWLRSTYPELSGGHANEIRLSRQTGGGLVLILDGTSVYRLTAK